MVAHRHGGATPLTLLYNASMTKALSMDCSTIAIPAISGWEYGMRSPPKATIKQDSVQQQSDMRYVPNVNIYADHKTAQHGTCSTF